MCFWHNERHLCHTHVFSAFTTYPYQLARQSGSWCGLISRPSHRTFTASGVNGIKRVCIKCGSLRRVYFHYLDVGYLSSWFARAAYELCVWVCIFIYSAKLYTLYVEHGTNLLWRALHAHTKCVTHQICDVASHPISIINDWTFYSATAWSKRDESSFILNFFEE